MSKLGRAGPPAFCRTAATATALRCAAMQAQAPKHRAHSLTQSFTPLTGNSEMNILRTSVISENREYASRCKLEWAAVLRTRSSRAGVVNIPMRNARAVAAGGSDQDGFGIFGASSCHGLQYAPKRRSGQF